MHRPHFHGANFRSNQSRKSGSRIWLLLSIGIFSTYTLLLKWYYSQSINGRPDPEPASLHIQSVPSVPNPREFLETPTTQSNRDSSNTGATVIAACKDRTETLKYALASWLAVEGVEEVIIVDWSSEIPIADHLSPKLLGDPRMKIVRVVDQALWRLSLAYNFAASQSRRNGTLLKVDCDTFLAPNFLEHHPLSPDDRPPVIYTGNWRTAPTENAVHLSGVFCILKNKFDAINGFDERIQSYGWDDSDIYNRMKDAGFVLHDLDYKYAFHIDHPSSQRTRFNAENTPAKFSTQRNRILGKTLVNWDRSFKRSEFSVTQVTGNRYTATLVKRVPSLEETVTKREFEQAEATATSIVLREYHVPFKAIKTLPIEYKKRMMMSYSQGKQMLIIPMHGLCNRLRALASAMAIAKATDRHLRVWWVIDGHLNAKFSDLFSNELDIWDRVDIAEFDRDHWENYNYMEVENARGKNKRIKAESSKHIAVKSAYRLNHYSVTPEAIFEALNELQPSKATMDLIRPFNNTGFIGVHIRNVIPTEEKGVDEKSYTDAALNQMTAYRRLNDVGNFEQEITRILKENPEQKFFLSCDSDQVKDRIIKRFGSKTIRFLDNKGCDDRSAKCLRFALADLLLLGKCDRLLGSFWSSYSEVAGSLTGNPVKYAGIDFPEREEGLVSGEGKPGLNIIYAMAFPTNLEGFTRGIRSVQKLSGPVRLPADKDSVEGIALSLYYSVLEDEVSSSPAEGFTHSTQLMMADVPEKKRPAITRIRALASSQYEMSLYLPPDTALCDDLKKIAPVILGDNDLLYTMRKHHNRDDTVNISGSLLFKNTPEVRRFLKKWETILLFDYSSSSTDIQTQEKEAFEEALKRSPLLKTGTFLPAHYVNLVPYSSSSSRALLSFPVTGAVKMLTAAWISSDYEASELCQLANAEPMKKRVLAGINFRGNASVLTIFYNKEECLAQTQFCVAVEDDFEFS